MIREVTAQDAEKVCAIYNHYVLGTTITFEEEAVSAETMRKRFADVTAMYPWLILEDDGQVLGYAYARKFHERAAYRHTAELAVYLAHECHGRGAGSSLYRELLARLKPLKVHVALGGIALPNEKSVALHEKLGFKKVAHLEEVGWKFERWIDVGYWELKL
ncbi:MAG: phosphinothricin N-acetyltransferase [Verrucomicrobia bacterium]|jgi:phosphinothricin acetyltransferase|nr:phosphinothricin N-acetyltransferase [Verrucomicrobiota bacterium]